MKTATVICDASFCNQARPLGGWAAWVRVDGWRLPIKGHGTIKDDRLQTSTDAEVFAALNGIWLAARHGGVNILVRSDCLAVQHLIRRETKSTRLLDIWESALAREDMQNLYLRSEHVKGHGKINSPATWVNDWCDRHAYDAMSLARKGKTCLQISND